MVPEEHPVYLKVNFLVVDEVVALVVPVTHVTVKSDYHESERSLALSGFVAKTEKSYTPATVLGTTVNLAVVLTPVAAVEVLLAVHVGSFLLIAQQLLFTN